MISFPKLKNPHWYFSYDKTCPRGDKADCFFEESSKYWFFLAFEANNCPGYISEYFWKSLTKPIIPVVMGGPGYKDQAPKNSYIDVNDYKSVEELANYMKYLVSNTVSSNQCRQLFFAKLPTLIWFWNLFSDCIQTILWMETTI